MKKTIIRLLAVLVLLGSLGSLTACGPRMVRHAIGAAFVGAAVAGTAVAVAHHVAHFHHYNCGCPRSWEDGRWVYYYEGGYEYYDGQQGVWLRIDD